MYDVRRIRTILALRKRPGNENGPCKNDLPPFSFLPCPLLRCACGPPPFLKTSTPARRARPAWNRTSRAQSTAAILASLIVSCCSSQRACPLSPKPHPAIHIHILVRSTSVYTCNVCIFAHIGPLHALRTQSSKMAPAPLPLACFRLFSSGRFSSCLHPPSFFPLVLGAFFLPQAPFLSLFPSSS